MLKNKCQASILNEMADGKLQMAFSDLLSWVRFTFAALSSEHEPNGA